MIKRNYCKTGIGAGVIAGLVVAAMAAGMITGCTKNDSSSTSSSAADEDETTAGDSEENGRQFEVSLDSIPSTGYLWQTVYISSNLTEAKSEYISSDPTGEVDGASGTEKITYQADADGKAEVILKYVGPTEGALPDMYEDYEVEFEDGFLSSELKTTVDCRIYLQGEYDTEHGKFHILYPDNLTVKAYEDDEYKILSLSFDDETGYCDVSYSDSPILDATTSEDITISGNTYTVGYNDDGNIMYINGNNICFTAVESTWLLDYFSLAVIMIDNLYFE